MGARGVDRELYLTLPCQHKNDYVSKWAAMRTTLMFHYQCVRGSVTR